MCGASFVTTWVGGSATQRRKLDSEVGLDHKLERISRIKLNEDIQHMGETK